MVARQLGEREFHAKQLWHWIYHRGVHDFDSMTDLSRNFRSTLEDGYALRRPLVTREQTSNDGTRKWLIRFEDGQEAEAVFIPEDNRGTVCISSQVGCTLNCRFCHTGTQRLVRNLSSSEMVGQFMLARDSYGEWPTPKTARRRLSNIVLMGMGEPLYNFDAVSEAISILTAGNGIAISKRRITLSTAGVVPDIRRCGEVLGINLAVSLHSADDDIRTAIMPINKKHPLKDLMAACRDYPGISNARRITFEYVMLKDVNDSPADARALVRLLREIPSKINIIPFNPWPGAPYEASSMEAMIRFRTILTDKGLTAPIRAPRGQDILAACGQLRTDSKRIKKHG